MYHPNEYYTRLKEKSGDGKQRPSHHTIYTCTPSSRELESISISRRRNPRNAFLTRVQTKKASEKKRPVFFALAFLFQLSITFSHSDERNDGERKEEVDKKRSQKGRDLREWQPPHQLNKWAEPSRICDLPKKGEKNTFVFGRSEQRVLLERRSARTGE